MNTTNNTDIQITVNGQLYDVPVASGTTQAIVISPSCSDHVQGHSGDFWNYPEFYLGVVEGMFFVALVYCVIQFCKTFKAK
jgi:hypothetical protein